MTIILAIFLTVQIAGTTYGVVSYEKCTKRRSK